MCACEPASKSQSKQEVEVALSYKRKPVSFYESGKPKAFDLSLIMDGKSVVVAYEELHENGAVKIKGSLDKMGNRNGLWESFYEDKTPWSIGVYVKGEETGQKRVWYPTGELRYEGIMEKGKPIGSWMFWSKTGEKSEKIYP
ncbi:MAG: antitoxin component YwqK of YwqJK toxin-antitoxin module [Halieaceae bacterium]